MNKDVINLIKDSASTILNIAQMTHIKIEKDKAGEQKRLAALQIPVIER